MLDAIAHEAWKLAGTLQSAALMLPDGDPDRELLSAISRALSRAGDLNEQQSSGPVEPQDD